MYTTMSEPGSMFAGLQWWDSTPGGFQGVFRGAYAGEHV